MKGKTLSWMAFGFRDTPLPDNFRGSFFEMGQADVQVCYWQTGDRGLVLACFDGHLDAPGLSDHPLGIDPPSDMSTAVDPTGRVWAASSFQDLLGEEGEEGFSQSTVNIRRSLVRGPWSRRGRENGAGAMDYEMLGPGKPRDYVHQMVWGVGPYFESVGNADAATLRGLREFTAAEAGGRKYSGHAKIRVPGFENIIAGQIARGLDGDGRRLSEVAIDVAEATAAAQRDFGVVSVATLEAEATFARYGVHLAEAGAAGAAQRSLISSREGASSTRLAEGTPAAGLPSWDISESFQIRDEAIGK